MPARKDPLHVAISIAAFISFYVVSDWILRRVMYWIGGEWTAVLTTVLAGALVANILAMRIYENQSLSAAGLPWARDSAVNLAFGLLGGGGAACLVLAPALLAGAAHLSPLAAPPSAGTLPFVMLLLAAGSVGEELLFRGFAFQILMRAAGPFAAILPIGVIFALMHGGNPNATWFGIANTAGFGILFGCAFWRTRDLWLPIGLHFGWNFTLPIFGVNVSGLKIGVTGHEMVWTAGTVWSGGAYGPEASVLTSVVLVALAVYIWKAPFRRQPSPLTDPPADSAVCEPSPHSPSSA